MGQIIDFSTPFYTSLESMSRNECEKRLLFSKALKMDCNGVNPIATSIPQRGLLNYPPLQPRDFLPGIWKMPHCEDGDLLNIELSEFHELQTGRRPGQ